MYLLSPYLAPPPFPRPTAQLFLDNYSFKHLFPEEDVFFLRKDNLGVPPGSSLLLPFRKAIFFSYYNNIFLVCLELTVGICVSTYIVVVAVID